MPEELVTKEKDDLVLKLSLEASLSVTLLRLFKQIAIDFRMIYNATGQVLDAGVYEPELVATLRPTYREAGETTGHELRNQFDIISDNREQIEAQTDLNLSNFVNKEPVLRARIINETTTRQLRNLTLQAIVALALSGIFPSSRKIAEDVSTRFVKRSKGHSQNIAITETLNAVEGARLTELNTLNANNVDIQSKKKEDAPVKNLVNVLFRRWESRQDERVRPTHVLAHGQTVRGATEPFSVGDSLLMYPGDTSLGADMREIIGCRCFAMTIIK